MGGIEATHPIFNGGQMNITLSEHSVVDIVLFFTAYLIGMLILIIKTIFDHRSLRKEFEAHLKLGESKADEQKSLYEKHAKETNEKYDKMIELMGNINEKLTDHLERITRVETALKK